MPFDARLVAIRRSFGEYSVYAKLDGGVDQGKFRQSARVANIAPNSGFRDFAGVFSRQEILEFGPDEQTSSWLANLPEDIDFIMVVLAEWESGM